MTPLPVNARVDLAHETALRAWERVATFSPTIVLNGSPDSALFTSHAASLRSLLIEASEATEAYTAEIQNAFPSPVKPLPADKNEMPRADHLSRVSYIDDRDI